MASQERTDPPPAVLGEALGEAAESEDAQAGSRMSFLEHLEELRRRIIYSLYSLLAAAVVPGLYADRIYKWMLAYFHQVLPPTVKMIYTQAADGFMFEFKLVLMVALLVASPFVFAQIWLFVAPGLYTRERKVVIPFVVCASALFLAGAAFSHYVAFIMMWKFLGGPTFSNQYIQFVPTIGEAFSLYIHITLILGIIFEMPVFVFFLTRFGLITWRMLVKQWKYAILGSVLIAAVVTPSPDYFSQFVVAVPMLALYGLSIGVAWVFRRREAA
ncbi:MAG TPA: twin-arginine translocase subunit TatC [Vicinamibacterales bacterium]